VLAKDIWGSIGVIGMLLNFAVAIGVAKFTSAPPVEVARLVDNIRVEAQKQTLKFRQAEMHHRVSS